MLRCNLAVLLAQRKLKITKVSTDTGISRTTLTALASSKGQGIQFETLNTLCNYLNVTPDQVLTFCPVEVSFDIEHADTITHGERFNLTLNIDRHGRREQYKMDAFAEYDLLDISEDRIETNYLIKGVDVWVDFNENEQHSEQCLEAINSIPKEFRVDLEDRLDGEIMNSLPDLPYDTTEEMSGSFGWPFD